VEKDPWREIASPTAPMVLVCNRHPPPLFLLFHICHDESPRPSLPPTIAYFKLVESQTSHNTVTMSETKEYTYQDVAEHNTKKDFFLVIHDKVYDCGKFVDEHPYVHLASFRLAH
jgi:cytochrome b involved in lipid metabolism